MSERDETNVRHGVGDHRRNAVPERHPHRVIAVYR
jgi:hypothetical protein